MGCLYYFRRVPLLGLIVTELRLQKNYHEFTISTLRLFCHSSHWATVKRVIRRFPRLSRIGRDLILAYACLHLPRTPTTPIRPRPIGRLPGDPSATFRMAHECLRAVVTRGYLSPTSPQGSSQFLNIIGLRLSKNKL
jgi:hypothetical protein